MAENIYSFKKYQAIIGTLNDNGYSVIAVFSRSTEQIIAWIQIRLFEPAENGSSDFKIRGLDITEILPRIANFNNQNNPNILLTSYNNEISKSPNISWSLDMNSFGYIKFLATL